MNRIFTAAAFVFAVALAGCDSINGFDPLDKLSELDIMGTSKKPLTGERHAVFPTGVPGVPQGVPPDMVKGYQPPAEAPPPVVEAKPEKPKPKPKPKKIATAPRRAPPPPQQAQPMQQAPAAQTTTTTQQLPPAASAPWPTIPGAQPTWPSNAPPAPQR